ncbi:superoxide dismutase [Blastochloris viridis]|uniref:Superoxide dismutase n=1 Tax=Blastochloris viridis TaxID=1079 RepID=A0A0H5BAM4_BLAVI|nr:superoxide dismutase [Blastochloris viridis]ALK08597.1 Superoxide dismutase [Mn] [Blastochloris viridis]BAR98114.1 manganese superoxide dismutase [Blastochloris viridis]CUU41260.1 Superoxide dismutase [Mn] [Blastochloris viridis]
MNRRDTLQTLATVMAVGLAGRSGFAFAQSTAPSGPFTLPPLGYDYAALEPHIDAQTMMIHHQRHHAGYVAKANALAADVPLLRTRSVEQILADLAAVPEASRTAVRNNVGGHWNHSFFWILMQPGGAREPVGALKAAIDRDFGGLQQLKERINAAGEGRFGSGWAWLVVGKDKKLAVLSSPNQDSPLMDGTPGVVLGVDVWEHAYYLKYQNRRPEYLTAWWNTVNWDNAESNYRKAVA